MSVPLVRSQDENEAVDAKLPQWSHQGKWLVVAALLVILAPAVWYVFSVLRPLKPIDQQLVDAVSRKDSGAVRRLLAQGADPDTRSLPQDLWEPPLGQITHRVWLRLSQPSSRREPVLLAAVNQADADTVTVLLDGRADANVWDESTETALICAAADRRHGRLNLPVIEALLAHGAHVDGRNGHGMTPLMFAAFEGTPAAASLLIAHGADVNARDESGQSVLRCARSRKDVTALLQQAGARP